MKANIRSGFQTVFYSVVKNLNYLKPNLLKLKADYQLLENYVIVALYRILWRTKGG